MRKGLLFSLPVVLVALIGYPALQWQRGRIRSQTRAMRARLIDEGYHVTLSFDYPQASAAKDANERFLIPASSDGTMHLVVMNRAILGSVDVQVTREGEGSVFSARGRNLDRAEDLRLSPGKYRLTVALHGARFGGLEIGVKQSITFIRDLDPRLYSKTDPKTDGPFSWPYYLYVPPKLGADDTNDSVVFRDGYEEEDERLIMARFGSTLQQRWKIAESLYRSAGLSAQFVLYPSVAHEVTPQMEADVVRFFRREMKAR